jgi:phosphohistidine phosphatase
MGQDKDKRKKGSAANSCLFLVRHGIAEDEHPLGDEARALTAEGRQEFRALARELRVELDELGFVGIVTSPLVRAVQTAEILAEACGIDEIRSEGALAAEVANATGITALARRLGPGWALVGHNPSLAATLGLWVHGHPDEVQFRKGAIAAVKPGAGTEPGTLVFVAAPGKKRVKTI